MDDQAALDLAKRAAFRAGRIAAGRLGQPGYLKWKGVRDVVPEAALEVQEAIVTIIQKECPDDAILSEEGPEDEPLDLDADRLWIVDPICGSLNFANGIPFFGISIARRVEGTLRVGLVHDPMRDETFAARFGEPATLNDREINAKTSALGPEFWEQSLVGVDLPHDGPRRQEALRAFALLSTEVLTQNIMGSPALGMCYVAAGRLSAYWNFDAKPWDVAAACVIVPQAGGLLTDAAGGPWMHSDGTYLAASPTAHTWAQRSLQFAREKGSPEPASSPAGGARN